jgi:hypothetical protein
MAVEIGKATNGLAAQYKLCTDTVLNARSQSGFLGQSSSQNAQPEKKK